MSKNKKIIFFDNYLLILILAKIILTYFYLNIYINYSSIGDARGYLKRNLVLDFNAYFPHILINRQHFVETIYAISNTLFTKHLTPYIFSVLSIVIIWNTCKKYLINANNTKYILFIIAIFSPSFALWTSVPSKELISVTLFIYLVNCFVKILFKLKINIYLFTITLIILAFIRPNYFLPYFIFLFISLFKIYFLDFLCKKYNFKLSASLFIIIFILILLFLIIFLDLFSGYIYNYLDMIIYRSYNMFYAFDHMSSSMRNAYLEWNSASDFFKYVIFGPFVSFSGPTIEEVFNRPVFIIYFIESIILNFIILYLLVSLLNLNKIIKNFYFIYLFGFITCFLIALIIHYPLGLFNLGSSLRYKQNIIPLMVFLPYMLTMYKNKI